MTKSQQPFEKKTERLDVRLSHQKKQSFSQACEDQGDTPSQAVRRFINSYVRRSKRDDIGFNFRQGLKRAPIYVKLGLVALIIGAFITPTVLNVKNLPKPSPKLFAFYDHDKSGVLEIGEIAPNDYHLHRILDIDGKKGISPEEFLTHGKMLWHFVDPDKNVIEDKKNAWKHKRVTVKHVTLDGHSVDEGYFMDIDGNSIPLKEYLENPKKYKISRPSYQELRNIPRAKMAKEDFKFSNKFVDFDLRGDWPQITVLEESSLSYTSKSMPFMRSVSWIEGAKSPDYVMGMGDDLWKSEANRAFK